VAVGARLPSVSGAGNSRSAATRAAVHARGNCVLGSGTVHWPSPPPHMVPASPRFPRAALADPSRSILPGAALEEGSLLALSFCPLLVLLLALLLPLSMSLGYHGFTLALSTSAGTATTA
jgi:hypothetical protein